jgi:rod shape-determining protein MreD
MKTAVVTAIWLIVAGACQLALAPRLAISGAAPDFILAIAIALSVNRTSDAASATGFFAGLVSGALLNSHMAAMVISRTVACWSAARISTASVAGTYLTVVIAAICATLAAAVLYLFVGVPKDILRWLLATFGACIYNTVIALILFAIFHRLSPRRI